MNAMAVILMTAGTMASVIGCIGVAAYGLVDDWRGFVISLLAAGIGCYLLCLAARKG